MRAERHLLFWLLAAAALILAVALLREILLPFVAGIVIAYFLSPLADRLTALGVPRTVASLAIVAAGVVLMLVALLLVVPIVIEQGQELAAALPAETDRVRAAIEAWAKEKLGPSFPGLDASLARAADAIAQNWTGFVGWAASSIWSGSLALVNLIALVLVTPLVVFYLLVDWHPMLAKADGWLPRDQAPTIRALAAEMNDATSAFIRGQGTVCLILGAFYAALLSLIGLDYGLLLGLATGALAFIPVIGWALGLIVGVALAVVQFWPETVPVLLVAGTFIAGISLDSGFLSPKIVGSKIGLHPVWLIFALFVFSYLFGLVGALIAVPLAAAVGVLVRFALRIYLASPVYQGRDPAAVAAETLSAKDLLA